MYVILVYDINLEEKEGQKILRNVFKICKKYLVHIQNSVFEGELLESQAIKLKAELDKYIREDKDSVILFKSRNQRWLDKEFLGKIEDDKTDNFLWYICRCLLSKKVWRYDRRDGYWNLYIFFKRGILCVAFLWYNYNGTTD